MTEIQLSPRVAAVAKLQRYALAVCALGVPVSIYYLLSKTGIFGVFWFLAMFLGSYAGVWVSFNVVTFFIVIGVYGSQFRDFAKEVKELHDKYAGVKEEKNYPELEFTIVATSEKPIARYMDSDIWEWIDLTTADGKKWRATYETVMNFGGAATGEIPEGCMLIPPGVVYRLNQVEDPISTTA